MPSGQRPTHYYIWYRQSGDASAARKAVDAVLRDIAIACGVQGRVLVRRDDPRTWMEIYENVADAAAFEQALAAAVQRHEAAGFAEDRTRHAEPFVAAI